MQDRISPKPAVLGCLVAGLILGLLLAGVPVALASASGPAHFSNRPSDVTSASSLPLTYWMAGADGAVYYPGLSAPYGSLKGKPLASPVVGIADTPDDRGYWLVAGDGGVFAFGDARFFGSMGGKVLSKPVVGVAATPDGGGYWLVASDGGVFAFGDARFAGSTGARSLTRPVVGIAGAPDGGGYWLVASDGGVFAFGDAGFFGSMGGRPLNKPVVGIAATVDGGGYWLAGADGGVFVFGDALFRGSLVSTQLSAPIVGIAPVANLNPFVSGTTGYDISWPQCGNPYPSPPFSFAIVGVGGSQTFSHNPCLASQVSWFGSVPVTLYVKLSSPQYGVPSQGNTGPAGTCSASDSLCRGYNYGWNLVNDAYRYASSQGASSSLWWLDVERPSNSSSPLWGTDLAANTRVVTGAIDALNSLGRQAGVYSNSVQWPLIVGNYSPAAPMWQARPNSPPANQYCNNALFISGPVWLVQYGNSPYDQNVAC